MLKNTLGDIKMADLLTGSLKPGLEMIEFQSPELHNNITAELTRYRESGKFTTKTIRKDTKIQEMLRKKTKMKISLFVNESTDPNAWVMLPMIDLNHPLFKQRIFGISEMERFWDRAKKAEDVGQRLTGMVDLEKGQVSGDFEDLEFEVSVTRGLLSSGLTAGEISAVILHEIGHAFSVFAFIGRAFSTNYMLYDTLNSLKGNTEKQRRMEIVSYAQRYFDPANPISEQEASDLADSDDKTLEPIILGIYARRIRNEFSVNDNTYYNLHQAEEIADMFASRHGAAADLATGLDKIMSTSLHYRLMHKESTPMYVATEIFKVLAFVFNMITIPFGIGAFMIIVKFAIGTGTIHAKDLYDTPYRRLEAINRQTVEAIKRLERSKNVGDTEIRNRLIRDFNVTSNVIKDMHDRKSLFEMIWKGINVRRWSEKEIEEYQRDIETLTHNELFVNASRINQMT